MIDRTNITWDLSRAGHDLTVYWIEPSEKPSVPAMRSAKFERDDAPWEPWQVTGILRSMREGVPLGDVCAGDRPHLSGLRRGAAKVGDSFVALIDRLTIGHPLEGGVR